MRFIVHDSLQSIEPAWKCLEQTGLCYGYQSFDWLSHWYEIVGKPAGIRPCPVEVVDDAGEPMMILPLALERSRRLKVVTFLGGDLTVFNAPIVANGLSGVVGQEEMQGLWRDIQAALPPHDARHLQLMPATVGGEPNPLLHLEHEAYGGGCHIVQTAGTWDEYFNATFTAMHRRNHRRGLRRLSEQGDLKLVLAGDVDEALRLTELTISEKTRYCLDTNRHNYFADQARLRFYRDITRDCFPTGLIHVSALTLDGTPISTTWCLLFKDRLHGNILARDLDKWAKYSPSGLLLGQLIEWCHERGISTFDMGPGHDHFKQKFCNRSDQLYRHLKGCTLAGNCYEQALRHGPVIKGMVKEKLERLSPSALVGGKACYAAGRRLLASLKAGGK